MKQSTKRNLINYLFHKQNGRCYYCDQPCELPSERNKHLHGIMSKLATIEHLYPKSDIRRMVVGGDVSYTRMACRECNATLSALPSRLLKVDFFEDNPTLLIDLLNGLYDQQFII